MYCKEEMDPQFDWESVVSCPSLKGSSRPLKVKATRHEGTSQHWLLLLKSMILLGPHNSKHTQPK